MSITSAPASSSCAASSTRSSSVRRSPASENESGVALTIPISHGRPPSASVPRVVRSGRAGALTGRPPIPSACGLLGEPLDLHRHALGTPIRAPGRPPRPRAPAPRFRARAARPASSPSRVRRSSTSPTVRGLLVARREDGPRRADPAGPGTIGWASSGRSAASAEHLLGGVAVAGRERARSDSPERRARRGSAAGSIGCPSGISCVRHGASRPSRSTSRSTASFAIRRQVVSLPPVIVISPLEVS